MGGLVVGYSELKVSGDPTPAMFADTGITLLFQACLGLGIKKERMVVNIAGGADVDASADYFHIGRENAKAAIRRLKSDFIAIRDKDTGSSQNRILPLHIMSGRVFVSSHNGRRELG